MRNLIDVINEMLDVIPDNEIELISKLKNIRKEQIYRAPESTVGWELISEELELINWLLVYLGYEANNAKKTI